MITKILLVIVINFILVTSLLCTRERDAEDIGFYFSTDMLSFNTKLLEDNLISIENINFSLPHYKFGIVYNYRPDNYNYYEFSIGYYLNNIRISEKIKNLDNTKFIFENKSNIFEYSINYKRVVFDYLFAQIGIQYNSGTSNKIKYEIESSTEKYDLNLNSKSDFTFKTGIGYSIDLAIGRNLFVIEPSISYKHFLVKSPTYNNSIQLNINFMYLSTRSSNNDPLYD